MIQIFRQKPTFNDVVQKYIIKILNCFAKESYWIIKVCVVLFP